MDAIKALGHSKPDDDWVLKPDQHADSLPPEAAPLAEILRGTKVSSILQKYKNADEKAITAQKKYKQFSKYGVVSASSAALIGAAILFLKSSNDVTSTIYIFISKYETYLLSIEGIAIALTALFAYLLKHNKYFDNWMRQRAKAETARVSLFEFICSVKDEKPTDSDIYLLQLKLEYFRRYQLEVQQRYYNDRGKQHEVAANKIVSWGGALTFVIVLVGAFSGVFNDMDIVSAIALMGVAIPVILSAHANLSLISQDERNAKRYANTYEHLLNLSGELDEIRNQVSNGNKQALIDFINAVNSEVSVEHREWVSLQEKSVKPKLEVDEYRSR